MYQCWWRICRDINVFARFEYHMFYVLYSFVTYLLTFPRYKFFYPTNFIRIFDLGLRLHDHTEPEILLSCFNTKFPFIYFYNFTTNLIN
jgi:hypothetical protein